MKKEISPKHWLYLCLMITSVFQWQFVTAQINLLGPSTQLKFVNPLPIPTVIDGRNGGTFTISINHPPEAA